MASRNDVNPLLNAATATQVARVRELLAGGADPNAADPWGRTPLQAAVRYAYNGEPDALEIVRALLAAGADVNAADDDGFTALTHAAVYGYPDLLRHLLAAGADPNRRDAEGLTVIGLIEGTPSLRGRRRVVKLLEQAGGQR
jgi:ankyrin repeat protein